MSISSMTGFARSQGRFADGACGVRPVSWVWEVRSVNGKGLDARLRWPPGYEAIEVPARQAMTKMFTRGNVSASLQVRMEDGGAAGLTVNTALLNQLMALAEDLPQHVAPPTFDGLLAVRGVLQSAEETVMPDEDRTALEAAIVASLDDALIALRAARLDEGARLHDVLRGQLAAIEDLTARSAETASARPEGVKARMQAQLATLLDGAAAVPEDRLAQELALLAVKADVREELDRLCAHIAQARELLSGGGPCGRRLDFLCQEFNREANTLCSKAQDTELTRIGLDLKAIIDQFREQIQNIE